MKRFISFIAVLLLLFSFSSCKAHNNSIEEKLLLKCNEERSENGKTELQLSESLCENAYIRAKECAQMGELSHTRPNGSGCFTVITQNYTYAGENLASADKLDAEKIVKSWMNSEEHKKNLLTDSFSEVGFGIYEQDGTYYIAQFFIG